MYIKTERGWKQLEVYCVNSNDLQGVFKDTPIATAQKQMSARADRFCKALEKFHPVHNASEFSGNHFNEPVFGAYGEKL